MLYAGTVSIKVLSTLHYVMPEWGLHIAASSGSMLNKTKHIYNNNFVTQLAYTNDFS
jgi:hypothetical protein